MPYFAQKPNASAFKTKRTWPMDYMPVMASHLLIMNYLDKLGIGYYYQWGLDDFDRTLSPEEMYKVDFYLSDYNIVIQMIPFGLSDKRAEWVEWALALWTFSGYRVVIWQEFEVYQSLDILIQRDLPELLDIQAKKSEEKVIRKTYKELQYSFQVLTSKRKKALMRPYKEPGFFKEKKMKRFPSRYKKKISFY